MLGSGRIHWNMNAQSGLVVVRRIHVNLLNAAARNTFTDLASAVHTFYEADRLGIHFLHSDWIFSPVQTPGRIMAADFRGPQRPTRTFIDEADQQFRTLGQLSTFCDELVDVPEQSDQGEFHWRNPSFGPYDAAIYYCLIRNYQPTSIVEIGGGYSTLIASKAVQQNGFGQVTCIEPHPRDFLRSELSTHQGSGGRSPACRNWSLWVTS